MPNMERGDGKKQSPECSFCLATASLKGFLHTHPQPASASEAETGAPRAGHTPPHNDVKERHTVISMMSMVRVMVRVRMTPLASCVNRTEATTCKSS